MSLNEHFKKLWDQKQAKRKYGMLKVENEAVKKTKHAITHLYNKYK